jgi:hypothetical protein
LPWGKHLPLQSKQAQDFSVIDGTILEILRTKLTKDCIKVEIEPGGVWMKG